MTIELPKYPASAGPAMARRLRERREQSAMAAEDLQRELRKLEDTAGDVLADMDARATTRQRLADLARSKKEINRRNLR